MEVGIMPLPPKRRLMHIHACAGCGRKAAGPKPLGQAPSDQLKVAKPAP